MLVWGVGIGWGLVWLGGVVIWWGFGVGMLVCCNVAMLVNVTMLVNVVMLVMFE